MSKRFNKASLFFIAVFICVFCVASASTVFAAAHKVTNSKDGGLVTSTHWIADAVGQQILAKGGNAMDAAAAVGYALAVVYPTAGNLGGGGFAVIHTADGSDYALDFREMAPAAAFREMYIVPNNSIKNWHMMTWEEIMADPQNGINWSVPNSYVARNYYRPGTTNSLGAASLNGPLGAGVPGTVAGLNAMVTRFGKLPLRDVIEPAIRLAGNGHRLTLGVSSSLNSNRTSFSYYTGSSKYFTKNKDGTGTWAENDLFVQEDLAQTLKRIAQSGSDGFYKGTTANMIVADMQKYGGIMTLDDLANYEPKWRTPAQGTYRTFKVVSMCPPSSGGTHIVQMLNTIENENIGTLGFNSVRTIWLMTEAMRYAYVDRSEYMGDPDFVNVPVAKLTSKDYGKEIYDKIVAHGFRAKDSMELSPGFGPLQEGEETTHFSVVDDEGNAVGITYTINMGYGCKLAVDGAGFFLNNEMDDFMSLPGKPNGFGLIQGEANNVQPKKRPLSSMSPTIVSRADGSIFLVTGSPGGSQIINTVLHTVVDAIDHGMNVSEVASAPRFHHQWLQDSLYFEPLFGFTKDTQAQLRTMGYDLIERAQGDVDVIMVGTRISTIASPDINSVITGSNDPRTFDVPPAVSFDAAVGP